MVLLILPSTTKKKGDFRCCWWLPSLIWLTTGCSILDDEQFVCSKSIEEIIEQALGLCSSYWWSDNRDEMNKSNDLRKARGNFDREGRMNNGTFFFSFVLFILTHYRSISTTTTTTKKRLLCSLLLLFSFGNFGKHLILWWPYEMQ